MSNDAGWVPPYESESLPTQVGAPPPAKEPGPTSPATVPPGPPPVSRNSPWWWLGPLIVVGSAAVLTVIGVAVAAVVWIVQPATDLSFVSADQPLTIGSPASPVALEPLVCPPDCFDRMSMRETILPNRSFIDLGVPDVTAPFGTWPEDTAGTLNRYHSADLTGHLEPASCFFVPTIAPYSAAQSMTEWNSVDPIFHTGTYEDGGGNIAEQSVRLFTDSASAERYMTTLSDDVAACDQVEIDLDEYYYRAVVDPAVSINPPRSVASIGWIATGTPGPGWRNYVYDIQRGNLVMRLSLYTDGSITEQDFRRVVSFAAAQLAAIPAASD